MTLRQDFARRTRILVPIYATICSNCLITSLASAADRAWTNGNNTNRWDQAQNWQSNIQPDSGDRALFATGTGAFVRLTTGAIGFQANVGTIQFTTARNQDTSQSGYYALEASAGSGPVSTISFAASGAGAGFVLNMSTIGSASWQSNSFYVGASAANDSSSTGTLMTSSSEAMHFRVGQKQRLNYYSTIHGTGSIVFDSTIPTYAATAADFGELTLGFGHGPTSSESSKSFNTFTGGVVVYSGKLNLAEDTVFDGGTGAITSSPAGLGAITFSPAVGTFTSNAALTGFDDRMPDQLDNPLPANSTRIVGNAINFNANVDITGVATANWNMELRGPVNFDNGSARTLNVFPSVSGHSTTMSGTITLGSGAGGFTLTKGGDGTLLISNAPVITTAGGGTIAVSSGTANYSVNSGVTRTFAGWFGSTGGSLTGTVVKSGAGTLEVKHVRNSRLNVDAGTLLITADGTNAGTSRVATLAIAGGSSPTASVDLNDNDLIVTGGSVSVIESQVKQARNGGSGGVGAWDGIGMTSTAARNQSQHNGALGVALGSDYGTGTTFDGFTVSATDVLVKYTYNGDANLSGNVTFDDYVRIDTGYNTHLTGWYNGDFNYTGSVTFDDYVLIDLAYNQQSGTRSDPGERLIELGQMWHFRLEGFMEYFIAEAKELGLHYTEADFYPDGRRPPTIPVPEPAVVASGALLAAPLLRRRRRG